jgi:hypothetical protein
MYIRQEIYNNKLTDILYPELGYILFHKETGMCYNCISLEDDRKEEDYIEIEEEISE